MMIVNSKNSKFNSASTLGSYFLIILLPNRSCDAKCLSSLFLNEFTEGTVTKEKGRLFHTIVILKLNEYFRRL